MQFDLTPAQRRLQTRARELAPGPIAARAAETDRTEEYPWDTVEPLKEAGFMGMTIPGAYGGAARPTSTRCWSSRRSPSAAASPAASPSRPTWARSARSCTTAPRSRSGSPPISCSAGDKPAICITEPDAGSAATEMTTRADRRGDRFVINGKKHWITGGGVSRLHLIFARVFDEQRRGAGDRRLHRGPRRDAGADHRRARAGDGPARHPRDRDHLRGHGGAAEALVLPPRGLARASPI